MLKMNTTPWQRQGCRACCAAWSTPSREPLTFHGTNHEQRLHLHQCGRCGAYWKEDEGAVTEISEATMAELLVGVEMDEKIREILSSLTDCFHGPEIVYQSETDLHVFRIEGQPLHWFYISRKCVEDHTTLEIEGRMFPDDELVSELKLAERSRWFSMDPQGLREVDADFCSGRAL